MSGLLITAMSGSFAQTVDPILANAKREPKMLAFSRVIGGSGRENVGAAAVDPHGNIYISGTTTSDDFPITPGAMHSPQSCRIMEHNGETQCKAATFLLKLSPDASKILYSATIDSSYSPLVPWAMAIAPDGSAFIAGQVHRPEDFPATPGAYRSDCTATWCAFLLKVKPDGAALEFATFFAGSAGDLPLQVLVDSESRPWITGRVQSLDYPVTPDAFQPEPGLGGQDFFLSVFSADGRTLTYSTFFGGNRLDGATGHLLSFTEILFAGSTNSSNFPITDDAIQATRAGSDAFYPDGFLTVLNIQTGLRYSTYLGGTFQDSFQSAAPAPNGAIFFTGVTTSPDFLGAVPNTNSEPLFVALAGILNPSERAVRARTFPGYESARILSITNGVAYVEFQKGAQSTIARISLVDNTTQTAYQVPEFTSQPHGYATAPKGVLIAASTQYKNLFLPDETTDIQVHGFRYVERSFAWDAQSPNARVLRPDHTLSVPLSLRDIGNGVPARVEIRCEQVPLEVECSVTPTEVDLHDAAAISVVIRQQASFRAALAVPLGLLLLGLSSRSWRRLLLVTGLGLVLISCRGIQETSFRSIDVVAESENYRATTTIHFVIEQR